MADTFGYFSETIEEACRHGMSEETKLILWGRIIEAVGRDDLTQEQGRRLEAMMGDLRAKYPQAFELAIFGDLEETGEATPAA